jgi:hypothetical protein
MAALALEKEIMAQCAQTAFLSVVHQNTAPPVEAILAMNTAWKIAQHI